MDFEYRGSGRYLGVILLVFIVLIMSSVAASAENGGEGIPDFNGPILQIWDMGNGFRAGVDIGTSSGGSFEDAGMYIWYEYRRFNKSETWKQTEALKMQEANWDGKFDYRVEQYGLTPGEIYEVKAVVGTSQYGEEIAHSSKRMVNPSEKKDPKITWGQNVPQTVSTGETVTFPVAVSNVRDATNKEVRLLSLSVGLVDTVDLSDLSGSGDTSGDSEGGIIGFLASILNAIFGSSDDGRGDSGDSASDKGYKTFNGQVEWQPDSDLTGSSVPFHILLYDGDKGDGIDQSQTIEVDVSG